MKEDDEYRVGRGKPPKEHQFKKGQSGNKKGRPKAPKSVCSHIEDELDRVVEITENGKKRKVKKRQLIAVALVNKAAKGDVRALNAIEKAREAGSPMSNDDIPWEFTLKMEEDEPA